MILAGTNDIAGNTGPISLEEIEDNFATMVELARAHGIRVVLSSVLPRPQLHAGVRADVPATPARRRSRR